MSDLAAAALAMTNEAEALSPVSVGELDEKLKQISALRREMDAVELQGELLSKQFRQLLAEIQPHLDAIGRTSYSLPGLGTVYKHVDNSYKMPQLLGDKVELFNYIEKKYGKDALLGYLSIHHQSLNTFVKEEKTAGSYTVPGLGSPTATESMRFRKG